MELSAQKSVLFLKILLQGLDMCEVVLKGLRGRVMLDERVCERFWVRRRGTEDRGRACEGVEGFCAFVRKVCFYGIEDLLVLVVIRGLRSNVNTSTVRERRRAWRTSYLTAAQLLQRLLL